MGEVLAGLIDYGARSQQAWRGIDLVGRLAQMSWPAWTHDRRGGRVALLRRVKRGRESRGPKNSLQSVAGEAMAVSRSGLSRRISTCREDALTSEMVYRPAPGGFPATRRMAEAAARASKVAVGKSPSHK